MVSKLDLKDFADALTDNEGIIFQKWILQMYFSNEQIAAMSADEIKDWYESIKKMEVEDTEDE